MKLFFHPNPVNNPILSEEESIHAVKVLRLKEKDEILILDGKGNMYNAIIKQSNPKKCGFSITKTKHENKSRSYNLHVAVSPTKNIDRMEWFVEKAIEVGIDEISFLKCEHSERKNINIERIEKIAVSALKQSLNLYLPKINEISDYSEYISRRHSESKYIAHLVDQNRKEFKNEIVNINDILILIGPEGDFSKGEIQLALTNNFMPVSLGVNRLRTETAALAACFICQTLKN